MVGGAWYLLELTRGEEMLTHLLTFGAHVADQLLLSVVAAEVDGPVAGEEGVLVHVWHRYMWRGSL